MDLLSCNQALFIFFILKHLASTIDLAPTFLAIANENFGNNNETIYNMDGKSLVNILLDRTSDKDTKNNKVTDWRESILIEHTGEYGVAYKGCPFITDRNMSVNVYINYVKNLIG